MVRRAAFLEVGGYYEPFFMEVEGLELAARFLVGGWEVRYLPAAVFHHKRNPAGRDSLEGTIRRRIRNQVWYFWLRFPADVAARRIIAYGVFDLANTFYRGVPGAWFEGLRDAWTQRELIRGDRSPAPRTMLRRIELRRGRMHMDLMVARAKEKLSGGSGAARRRETGDPWSRATRDG